MEFFIIIIQRVVVFRELTMYPIFFYPNWRTSNKKKHSFSFSECNFFLLNTQFPNREIAPNVGTPPQQFSSKLQQVIVRYAALGSLWNARRQYRCWHFLSPYPRFLHQQGLFTCLGRVGEHHVIPTRLAGLFVEGNVMLQERFDAVGLLLFKRSTLSLTKLKIVSFFCVDILHVEYAIITTIYIRNSRRKTTLNSWR